MFTVYKSSLLVYKLVRIMKIVVSFCYGCAINACNSMSFEKRYILCGIATKEKHDNDPGGNLRG